eukprot:scaffold8363_cov32-Tisochrysis_lutea.AAC.3
MWVSCSVEPKCCIRAVDVTCVVWANDGKIWLERAIEPDALMVVFGQCAQVMKFTHGVLNLTIVAPLQAIVIGAVFDPHDAKTRERMPGGWLVKAEQPCRLIGGDAIAG